MTYTKFYCILPETTYEISSVVHIHHAYVIGSSRRVTMHEIKPANLDDNFVVELIKDLSDNECHILLNC